MDPQQILSLISASVYILVVELDERRIGLPVGLVRGITRAAAITPLPGAPGIVEGVLNLHGTLVPVVDVRQRFGLEGKPLDPDQYFVLAEAGRRRVVLRVDRVLHVLEIAADQLEPAWDVVPHAEHVAALGRLPDGVLVIHDLQQFLSLEEEETLEVALDRTALPLSRQPE